MPYRRFRPEEPRKRRSKTAGTGTGEITTDFFRLVLDKKTVVFVKNLADFPRIKAKWEQRQAEDQKSLQRLSPDAPSQSDDYRKKYLKKEAKKYREKKEKKKNMGLF